MKKLSFLVALLISSCFAFAQNVEQSGKKVKNYVSSEYNRNTLTLVGLDFSENLSSQLMTKFSGLAIPDKYYDNPLQSKVLKPGVGRDGVSNTLKQIKPEVIEGWLNDNKVGQQILSTWFNRQPDGSFNVDVLKQRGLFNADDNDFMVAGASKRGESSLMDMGLQLVNQSYALVFDFYNIMDMNQYYDANEVETSKRVMNGYRASMRAYLYKLEFNDSVAAVFFQDYWIGAQSTDKQARVNAFNEAEFPFVPLSNHYGELLSTQFNPGQTLAPKVQKTKDELLAQLAQMAFDKVMNEIEKRNEAFRVKAMVSSVKPIAAKIGKKEGLKFDQRYFVYENRERRNGDVFSRRVGVIKSMKVVDNRKVTTGQTDPSQFYQIAGGSVDNYGMFIEQHNDAGLNIFLGTTIGGLEGFTGRAEYYISKILGEVASGGKNAQGLTAIKLYAEGAFGKKEYDFGVPEDFSFARWSVGLNKDFYPLNFLHWGPFIGYGMETITWESDTDKILSDFIEMGARVGVNLAHNIQLIGSANYYMLLTSEGQDSDGVVIEEDFQYKDYFDDRMGFGVSAGLRIMF